MFIKAGSSEFRDSGPSSDDTVSNSWIADEEGVLAHCRIDIVGHSTTVQEIFGLVSSGSLQPLAIEDTRDKELALPRRTNQKSRYSTSK